MNKRRLGIMVLILLAVIVVAGVLLMRPGTLSGVPTEYLPAALPLEPGNQSCAQARDCAEGVCRVSEQELAYRTERNLCSEATTPFRTCTGIVGTCDISSNRQGYFLREKGQVDHIE
jgi:hypothetical protein